MWLVDASAVPAHIFETEIQHISIAPFEPKQFNERRGLRYPSECRRGVDEDDGR